MESLLNHPRTAAHPEADSWWRQRFRFKMRRPAPRPPRSSRRTIFYALLSLSAVFGALSGLAVVYSIDLPQMEDLTRYRPNTTTELLDVHGRVFGSFALERRVVVPYTDFPPVLREAIISIEDKSFESNWGVNLVRAVGAAWRDLHSSGRSQGASTLTMQLARNLFLSSEKTYGRKLQEILLSMQIERRFTKDQIFALYANQIYLGHGTYGFESGSEYFFSKHARNLTLPEAALLAALPKGPEAYSPIRAPQRALKRRNLVLDEMLHDGAITQAQADQAKAAPLGLRIEAPVNSEAPYFVEEVRRQLEREYGVEEVHGAGLRVYTTLDLDLQQVANRAVLDGVATYERRRGWQGKLLNVAGLEGGVVAYRHPDWAAPVSVGAYFHVVVLAVSKVSVTVRLGDYTVTLTQPDWTWVLNSTQTLDATKFLAPGDIVYVRVQSISQAGVIHALLEQDSGAQGSLMAVDNNNGEILAMVGGRDFATSQFNRATQAQRQVGSSFKPYVYTTAIENGAKPTDIVVDEPTSFPTPSGWYTPHNYEKDYRGPMTLTNAFAESRNIPALKLAHKYGIQNVIATAHRFGITSNIPPYLPIALGSADITLAEQVGAYTVFPNDGIRIEPHTIRKVSEADGLALQQKPPQVTEVLSVETARSMMGMLEAVTRFGTAASASKLNPIGGKTGTTNNYTDAWFIGFSPAVTCGTWIGFDDRQTLGEKETGARAALPMWMNFMTPVVAAHPHERFATGGAPKRSLEFPDSTGVEDAAPRAPRREPAPADDGEGEEPSELSAPEPAPTPAVPAPAQPAAPVPTEPTTGVAHPAAAGAA